MSREEPRNSIAQSDRRNDARLDAGGRAKLRIGNVELDARIENRSTGGMFLVIDESIACEIVLGEGASEEVEIGRLVRLSSLPGERSGIGISLDQSEPVD